MQQKTSCSSHHTQNTQLAVCQLQSRAVACQASSSSSSNMAQPVIAHIARRALQYGLSSAVTRALGASSRSRSSTAAMPGWGAHLIRSSSGSRSGSHSSCSTIAAMPRQSFCCATAGASNSSSSSSSSSVKRPSSKAAGDSWVVNKEPISSAMTPQLYSYLLAHTREPAVLQALRLETASMQGGHMQIAPEQGQLLSLLVELLGVRSAIEVGVFTGYSSLAVALALPEDGRLVAFDRDPVSMEVARRYWDQAGVSAKVDSRLGPAHDGLLQLLQDSGENSFDFAFIDADKRGYQAYFELCLKLVRPGGLIAVDNVLFYGKVADAAASDKATMALKQFNVDRLADVRVSFAIIPIGDGMALCRKR